MALIKTCLREFVSVLYIVIVDTIMFLVSNFPYYMYIFKISSGDYVGTAQIALLCLRCSGASATS